MTHADVASTIPRRTLVMLGHIDLVALSFLFARVPLSVLLGLFAGSGLLLWAGHGSLRGPGLTFRQRVFLISGFLVCLFAFSSDSYREASRASVWLPRQPVLVWFAMCGAFFDLARLRQPRRA